MLSWSGTCLSLYPPSLFLFSIFLSSSQFSFHHTFASISFPLSLNFLNFRDSGSYRLPVLNSSRKVVNVVTQSMLLKYIFENRELIPERIRQKTVKEFVDNTVRLSLFFFFFLILFSDSPSGLPVEINLTTSFLCLIACL
jgi:hypothetical protein